MPLPPAAWYVYIIRCLDRTLYTGITTDLTRRLAEHNSGRGAKYTRPRRPVVLVYSEPAISRSAAASREYEIKKLPLVGKMHLIGAVGPPHVESEQASPRSGK